MLIWLEEPISSLLWLMWLVLHTHWPCSGQTSLPDPHQVCAAPSRVHRMSSTVSDHGTQLTEKTKLEEVGEVVLLSFVASCYRLGRDSWQIRLCEAAGMEGAGSCSYFKEGWTAPSAVPTIPLMPQVDNLTPSLTIASLDDAWRQDGPRLQAHWQSSAGV
jgi:hypothetical protein